MQKKNVLSRCPGSRVCGHQCPPSANHLVYVSSRVSPDFNLSLSLSLRYFLLHGAETARARKGKNILLEFLNLTMKLIFVVDCSVWRRARPASPCVEAAQCIGFG